MHLHGHDDETRAASPDNSNDREIYFIISELLSKGIDKDATLSARVQHILGESSAPNGPHPDTDESLSRLPHRSHHTDNQGTEGL